MAMAKKIGQILLEKGLITKEQLEAALKEQTKSKALLGSILVKRGLISDEQLTQALAEQYNMPYLRLGELSIDRKVIERIPLKVALHYKIMPLRSQGSDLTLAISNPQDVRLQDELRQFFYGRLVKFVLSTEKEILEAIKRGYGIGAQTMEEMLEEEPGKPHVTRAVEEEAIQDIEKLADDASIIKLVNQVLLEAYQNRATDVHFEPFRERIRIRYRVDGILHEVDVPPAIRRFFPAIVSRLKIMSNLDIVERRLPQGGRVSIKVGKEKLDLRISILPAAMGESVVVRILPIRMLFDLKDLGFLERDLQLLEKVIQKPYGLVFLTGPTGSGKTTTLYAFLKKLNTQERKIISIEDPIEYELEGIIQMPINPQIGLSFAEGLRNMLRHDPDVMMVGEVRDLETAELAIRIALTGHLIFSTLHTNDATSGITRLMDMGIPPYLITSAVECFISQRLVRLLCPNCKEKTPYQWSPKIEAYRTRGCEACNHTGFLGRTAIYEILHMKAPIKDLVMRRAPAGTIRQKAIELGMRPLEEDGWEKVEAGLTSPDEILRVTMVED